MDANMDGPPMDLPRNDSFNPFTQQFKMLLADGRTTVTTGVPDVNYFLSLSAFQAITYSSQIGAAIVLLAAIALMTKPEKRRSAVFLLNVIALLLVVFRGAFQLAVITGPLFEWFRWKTHTYIDLGNSKAIAACSDVAGLFLTIAILFALFVQVKIVCCNLSDARRHIINASNGVVIATAIAMRLVVTIMDIRWNIIDLGFMEYESFELIGKMASAANITLVLAIAFSTIIFTTKLGSAILARRSMGMKQFGPMQIIFVMGCQTMFTPLIFTIICYTTVTNANIQSFAPVIVAVSLPLSGMWASVNTDSIHIASAGPRKHRVVPLGASTTTYGGSSTKGPSSSSTYYDDDKYGLTMSPVKTGRVESDLEMQNIRAGVNVERTYSVRSD